MKRKLNARIRSIILQLEEVKNISKLRGRNIRYKCSVCSVGNKPLYRAVGNTTLFCAICKGEKELYPAIPVMINRVDAGKPFTPVFYYWLNSGEEGVESKVIGAPDSKRIEWWRDWKGPKVHKKE